MSSTKLRCDGKIWEERATRAAISAGLCPVKLLSGLSRDRRHVSARWSAWRSLIDEGFTLHSVAVASGYDHATVTSAMKANKPPYSLGTCSSYWRGKWPPNLIDLTGKRFGKLTVLERSAYGLGTRTAYWACQCDCGRYKVVKSAYLRLGHVKSCGCLARKKAA